MRIQHHPEFVPIAAHWIANSLSAGLVLSASSLWLYRLLRGQRVPNEPGVWLSLALAGYWILFLLVLGWFEFDYVILAIVRPLLLIGVYGDTPSVAKRIMIFLSGKDADWGIILILIATAHFLLAMKFKGDWWAYGFSFIGFTYVGEGIATLRIIDRSVVFVQVLVVLTVCAAICVRDLLRRPRFSWLHWTGPIAYSWLLLVSVVFYLLK